MINVDPCAIPRAVVVVPTVLGRGMVITGEAEAVTLVGVAASTRHPATAVHVLALLSSGRSRARHTRDTAALACL